MKLEIHVSEACLAVGRRRSGKTTLMRRLARAMLAYQGAVFHDPKRDPGLRREFEGFPAPPPGARPGPGEILWARGLGEQDAARMLRQAWRWGNVLVLLDELYLVGRPPELRQLYATGASRLITVLATTQRPMQISQEAISESEHLFVFRLGLAGDRKKLEEGAGIDLGEAAQLPPFQWLYYGPAVDRPIRQGPLGD